MIKDFIKENNIEYYENISLKKHNTYQIDTLGKYLLFPKNNLELQKILRFIKENSLKYLLLGNGSNIIFKNDVYDGIIIKLDKLNKLKISDNIVTVQAGYSLIKLAIDTANLSLSGLEFAAGIPGQIGASTAMNAGAYKEDLGSLVIKVKVINPNLEIEDLTADMLEFNYRNSFFKQHKDYVILEVVLKLKKEKTKQQIFDLINDRRRRRMISQPLEYPSAGSVFRNPDNDSAGRLIEECGLKNRTINGATISTKHANFIINQANAHGSDIINLINLVKEEVKNKYHIDLVLEQEIIE